VNKRKQIDKESEVYVNGVEYAADKVKKVRYGKAYVSAFETARASGGELCKSEMYLGTR
jgi:hypothetical protein